QPAAEAMYRRHLAESGRPEGLLLLAGYLGRRPRLAEGLDCCEKAGEQCPPAAAAAGRHSLLRAGRGGGGDCRRVGRRAQAALAKQPGSAALLVALAGVCDHEQHWAEAEALLRKVLETEPGNAVALNNLAWMLACRPGQEAAALELIQRALDGAGPLPNL